MDHSLTPQQKAQYERDGFLAPVPVFSPTEAAALRGALERFEQAQGGNASAMRTDLHLLERWAFDAITDDRVVAPVVSLLGPDVLLWSMNWFIKEARDGKVVTLHQDANYWGLEPHDVTTAWIALSDAGEATGPMRFLPGSHKGPLYDHENTFAQENLLSRGQVARVEIDDAATQLAPLSAGEMSLHHVRTLHGSDRNETDDRRIGMVLRFCATHVRQTKGEDTAVLVSGEDSHGHFTLLPAPAVDNGETEIAQHADAIGRMHKIIMSD